MGAYKEHWEELKTQLRSKQEFFKNEIGINLHLCTQILDTMDEIEGPTMAAMRNQIHDRYMDIFDSKPTEETITAIAEKLPKGTHAMADAWGWDDTEVAEMTYSWIENEWKTGDE